MDVDPIQQFLRYDRAVSEGWERLTWTYEETNKWGSVDTDTAKTFNREEIQEWCQARCKGPWLIAGGTVLIKNPKEAMLFKLTFIDSSIKHDT